MPKFDLKRFGQLALMYAPQILSLTPLAPIAEDVAKGIIEAAGLHGASNDQKLAHVRNVAVLAADAANKQAGHQVVDPQAVGTAADGAISETYQVIKLLHNSPSLPLPAPEIPF